MLSKTRNPILKGLLLMTVLLLSSVAFSQGSLSGRCTDKNGVPLKGVQVTAILFDERHTTETNGDGYYEDKQLAPGEWTVMYVYGNEKIVKKVPIKDAQTRAEMNVMFNANDKR